MWILPLTDASWRVGNTDILPIDNGGKLRAVDIDVASKNTSNVMIKTDSKPEFVTVLELQSKLMIRLLNLRRT